MKRWLVRLALAAGIAGAAHGWIAVAPLTFHAGLLLCALALAGLSAFAARRHRSTQVFVLNTLVCLLVGIVLADRAWFSREREDGDERFVYSFTKAGGSPDAFLRWHKHRLQERKRRRGQLIRDPRGVNPHVLKPGTWKFFESTWRVNSLGFRGPEISVEKGDRYRIVAIGESTTFVVCPGSIDRSYSSPSPKPSRRLV